MFGKKAQPPIKSLIAQGSRIEGNLKFTEGLRIDGEVFGDIRANSEQPSILVISRGGGGPGRDPCRPRDHQRHGARPGERQANCWNCSRRPGSKGMCCYKALEMHQGAIISGQLRPLLTADEKPLLKLAAKNP